MALYKSKGIVLRSMRYGEADRILDLYTQDAGLVSAIAKGIRRTKSRFGARLEPLSCVDFMAYHGRTLDTITQVETLRSFRAVREDLGRFKSAGALVRTVRALSGGDEADRRVFNLLYHALDALEARSSGFEALEAAFDLKLSMLAGYAPQIDVCQSCGTALEEAPGSAYFSPNMGGGLCSDCRTAAADAFLLPPGALDRLKDLIERPMREVAPDDRLDESARRVVRAHVFAHAPGSTAATRQPSTLRPA